METIFVKTLNGNSYCDTEQGIIIGSVWQEVEETSNINKKIADGALVKQSKEEAEEAKTLNNATPMLANAKKGDKK